MATVQRRTPSRLFQTTEYRIFNPNPESYDEETNQDYCVFLNKLSRNRRQDVTFIKQKSYLLREACFALHLEYINSYDMCAKVRKTTPNLACGLGKDNNSEAEDGEENFMTFLPRELTLKILKNLQPKDISNFARCSKTARFFSYDDLLWKHLCFSTWCDPGFMSLANLSHYQQSLRSWYNMNSPDRASRANTKQVLQMFLSQRWRIIYAAMQEYEAMPSIINRQHGIFNRTAECFPTSRTVKYHSSIGNFKLAGVTQSGLVEYLVLYAKKPWHRKCYMEMLPLPIYSIRDYGLKITRSPRGQHNGEFFRRRGYYIKTDENRKVHLTYRYFPTIRFRLFKQKEGDRVFLLCQDVFVSSGETVDCYTAYEITRSSDEDDHLLGVYNDITQ